MGDCCDKVKIKGQGLLLGNVIKLLVKRCWSAMECYEDDFAAAMMNDGAWVICFVRTYLAF